MSLEDLPRASLYAQPEQEKALIAEEEKQRLSAAVNKLTGRERKLFQQLCMDGLRASEIAEEIGIKLKSVYSERFALIVKVRRSAYRAILFYADSPNAVELTKVGSQYDSNFLESSS
jgi:RNA polymerase sigma factor (sigma-70 family)